MRAQSLTISVPYNGCDKNCPYCVSKITGTIKTNRDLMVRNANKVLNFARSAQVTSVLITGKGEPFRNFGDVLYFTRLFAEFPVEVQTNGLWLSQQVQNDAQNLFRPFTYLYEAGMNVIAVSVDDPFSWPSLGPRNHTDVGKITQEAHQCGMLVRVTFNVTKMLNEGLNEGLIGNDSHPATFKSLMRLCHDWNVDQMTFRNIVSPNHTKETPQTKWIKKFVDPNMYERIKNEMDEACASSGFLIRVLPHGSKVYDYEGVAVSYSDYCIQDSNNTDDIRSLIYQEDGHLYTSWNSNASILF